MGARKADDGLTRPWDSRRVWCNPPFSDIGPWVLKAWTEMGSIVRRPMTQVIAMLLPASRTEQPWWQDLVEPWRDGKSGGPVPIERGDLGGVRLATHCLPERTRFGHPGNPEGVGVGSPPFGCVLLVWRRA